MAKASESKQTIQEGMPEIPQAEATVGAQSVEVAIPKLVKPMKHSYWCGIMPDSGLNGAMVCGASFPRQTEHLMRGGKDGDVTRIPQNGVIVRLSDKKVEAVKKSIVSMVVRTIGQELHVIRTGTENHPEMNPETDTPLAAHVYMVRCDGLERRIRSTTPRAMLRAAE